MNHIHISWLSRAGPGHVLAKGCDSHKVDTSSRKSANLFLEARHDRKTYGILSLAMARADDTTVAAPPVQKNNDQIKG
jgi:hypothetical protein